MAEELNNVPQQEPETTVSEPTNESPVLENAGCLGIGASVLFPIIGIIIYFCQKKEVNNPEAYLWGAFAGFAIGIILRLISGAM